jgi:hypothetical protein
MTDIDPGVEKAFSFAQDVTKQLISLATGIIAVTITFLVDVLQRDQAGGRGTEVGMGVVPAIDSPWACRTDVHERQPRAIYEPAAVHICTEHRHLLHRPNRYLHTRADLHAGVRVYRSLTGPRIPAPASAQKRPGTLPNGREAQASHLPEERPHRGTRPPESARTRRTGIWQRYADLVLT